MLRRTRFTEAREKSAKTLVEKLSCLRKGCCDVGNVCKALQSWFSSTSDLSTFLIAQESRLTDGCVHVNDEVQTAFITLSKACSDLSLL